MMHVFLLFALIFPAFAGQPESPDFDGERSALEKLQDKFEKFRDQTALTDQNFLKLRNLLNRHRYREAVTLGATLSRQVRAASRQWREIESSYNLSIAEGLNLHRRRYMHESDLAADVVSYLAFRKGDRYERAPPLGFLLAAWRGLKVGHKTASLPDGFTPSVELAGLRLGVHDSLLIIMNDGGLVRGRFIGGHGTTLALREVLPNTLRIYQTNLGHYRILDLTQAARVEVIRKPVTVAPQASPQPAVGLDGEYARSYVKPEHIFRVKLQSDDLTLLKLVKQRNFRAWEFEPSVEPIDLARETKPAYSPLYFYNYDCASFLQRGS